MCVHVYVHVLCVNLYINICVYVYLCSIYSVSCDQCVYGVQCVICS